MRLVGGGGGGGEQGCCADRQQESRVSPPPQGSARLSAWDCHDHEQCMHKYKMQ